MAEAGEGSMSHDREVAMLAVLSEFKIGEIDFHQCLIELDQIYTFHDWKRPEDPSSTDYAVGMPTDTAEDLANKLMRHPLFSVRHFAAEKLREQAIALRRWQDQNAG